MYPLQDIATQILEILVYLQALTPPIIHRDIKPQNIIRQEDGQVFLVDFGAVQDIYHHTVTGGSTVVGTFGYMAPEQFRGQAVLSTDLYGLGTTLLFLLTQKSPADLPQRQLKINFRSHVQVSEPFADWLEKMIEPVSEDRFRSAEVALEVLQGKQELTNYSLPRLRRPKNSSVSLTKTEESLVVEIPSKGFSNGYSLLLLFFFIVWNGFLLGITWFIIETLSWDNLLPSFLFFVFLTIYAWFGLRRLFILSPLSRTRLMLDKQSFCLQQWFLGRCLQNVQGQPSDIDLVDLRVMGSITVWMRQKKWREYDFGIFLTQLEKEWLVSEINAFLEKLNPR